MTANNPILWADYPDLDIIRVEDTYYMVSTTMHMFPGCVILRSYDLIHWETASHVYEKLGESPAQSLENGDIYGKGMWAASLRYHKGVFHVVFCANDTHKMYHYTAVSAEGPWEKHPMSGFYHDNSVLFDDDGRVYIVYGNREIHITELKDDLSEPKRNGLDKVILVDDTDVSLGYEGAHLYKIDGRYYLFLIHWPSTGNKRRTEAVFSAESLDGVWIGGECLDDDLGFHNMGVAQGGIVDTPDGKWYAMLFQDHGAVGRIPVLVPVFWKDHMPSMGPVSEHVETTDLRPGYHYSPLIDSDDFSTETLRDIWQWNHEPDLSLVRVDAKEKVLYLRSGRIVKELTEAPNTLTQRTCGPKMHTEVTVDASGLKDGDYAGLCALQGLYAQLALTKKDGQLLLSHKKYDGEKIHEETLPLSSDVLRISADFDFEDMQDQVVFQYLEDGTWCKIGTTHHLEYRLDHFMGCRVGLFLYSTMSAGGEAEFSDFKVL